MNIAVPYVLLAGMSIMGGIAASFLPETLNQKLPESLEEAEQLGRKANDVEMVTTPEGEGVVTTT